LLRSVSRLLTVLAIALVAPTTALAQDPVTIDGHPLKTTITPDGRIQVNADGREFNELFPASSSEGNAGFGLVIGAQQFGILSGGMGTPVSGPTLIPTSDPNHFLVSTTWDLPSTPTTEVIQVVSYQNGERELSTVWGVENTGGGSPTEPGRAFAYADLAVHGSDSGTALFQPGPPRFVGALNQDVGAAGGFVELVPWSHYQAGPLPEVQSAAQGQGFNNSISTAGIEDSAAGVDWDFAQINAGDSFTVATNWRFVNTLLLTPTSASAQTGASVGFTAQIADTTGTAGGKGSDLRWDVSGANETSETKTETDASGRSKFSYVGGVPGEDTVTVYNDENGNKTHDDNEPQASATVTWDGPPPPVKGEIANARPEKGKVLVKLPKGANGKVAHRAAKRLGVRLAAAQNGFTALKENTPIPMGSTLDTTKGTVRLLTAASATKQTGGSPYSAFSFNGGQFGMRQAHGSGLTTLTMRGGGVDHCGAGLTKAGHAVAARKRGRKLFGRGSGRFRTRGRNSSATVRGTAFLVKDTCKGTLTSVTKGRVDVRDFVKHRNITLVKGEKYFAKARTGKKRKG
jgi:hypothetical protein